MLQDYFQGLTDKRQPWKIKHKLLEIVVMTICAVIAGCDVWEDIMDFCRMKECWFRQSLHMELANGIPSHDTMHRVWGMLDPNEFRQHFRTWNVSEEVRYFITSLSDVNAFAKAARAHWGIENSLRWCLDTTFHEDYSRVRKDHSAENMAVVHHIALDILRQHPAKVSLARKRRRCAYDDAFLADVLRSVHA